MSKSLRILFLVLLVFVQSGLVKADRGAIPISLEASVYEPGQKAILAWNGHEEVMILSTDVSSSAETLVIEILPLPSQPAVEAASFESFTEVQMLMWQEASSVYSWSIQNDSESQRVEVVFYEQIGAHNISVVKSSDAQELVVWMNDFLEQSGVKEKVALRNFESVVQEYMNHGYRYYVLDLITVTREERSVNPILYRFNCSFLYYPLVITTPVGGDTQITLFLITDGKPQGSFYPLHRAHYIVEDRWESIEFLLSVGDLARIDLRIAKMFADGAWFSVLTYEGDLKLLTRDLVISDVLPLYSVGAADSALLPSLFAVGILLGSVTTLAGVLLTLLITRERKNEKGHSN